jgi:hypothetical protein
MDGMEYTQRKSGTGMSKVIKPKRRIQDEERWGMGWILLSSFERGASIHFRIQMKVIVLDILP